MHPKAQGLSRFNLIGLALLLVLWVGVAIHIVKPIDWRWPWLLSYSGITEAPYLFVDLIRSDWTMLLSFSAIAIVALFGWYLSLRRKAKLSLLAINVLGALLFLLIASKQWIEPSLADVPGASGGAGIVWMLNAVPVFLLFVLLDICALAWECAVGVRERRWPELSWLLLSLPFWVITLIVDQARHGI